MSDFKNKLLNLINESAPPQFANNILNYNIADEMSIVGEIAAAAPLSGMKYLGHEEGVLSFSTYQPAAVEKFAMYLDDSEYVDTYDISAVITDPMSRETKEVNEIDLDNARESQFIEYFVDVIIDSSQVAYNDIYVNPISNYVNDISQNPFVYSVDNNDNINSQYDNDNDYEDEDEDEDAEFGDITGYDALDIDETPLLIHISSVKSYSAEGDFSITIHPQDSSKILIQCNYAKIPDQYDVLRDLEILNNGDFGPQFKKEFNITKEAIYTLGDLYTTSAEYKARAADNVLDIIVETFKNEEIKHVDMFLTEITRVIKINFKGKKRIKMSCGKGYKYDAERKVCVKIGGSEMAKSRVAHRQMSRTKKALGSSYKTKILRKVRKAKRFRKLMGF